MALEKSLDYLKQAKDKLAKQESEIALRVARTGVPVVEFAYALAPGNDKDYIVAAEPFGKGACLIAHGDDIVFREFGAGVSVASDTVHSGAIGLPPIKPGSFSATEGTGEFAKYGSWHRKGIKYTGLAPTLGMYNAYIEMKRNALRIAQEVMGK